MIKVIYNKNYNSSTYLDVAVATGKLVRLKSNYIPISINKKYELTFFASYSPYYLNPGSYGRINIAFWSKDKTRLISAQTLATNFPDPNQWTRYVKTITPPMNNDIGYLTIYLVVDARNFPANNYTTVDLDSIQLRDLSGSNTIPPPYY